jgi:spectinomycin phosphotransferase
LVDLGIKQVISPLVTKTGQLWTSLASFKAILYPYVDGNNGVDAKPSDDHWVQFGATIKKLQSLDFPEFQRIAVFGTSFFRERKTE